MAYLTLFASRLGQIDIGEMMTTINEPSQAVTAYERTGNTHLTVHVDDVAKARQLAAAILESCDRVERARSGPVELPAADLEVLAEEGARAEYDAAGAAAEAEAAAAAEGQVRFG